MTTTGVMATVLVLVAHPGTADETSVDEAKMAQIRRVIESRVVVEVPGQDRVDVRRDLVYRRDGDARMTMDVYLPGAGAEERRPVVLLVHGGPVQPELTATAGIAVKDWGVFRSYGEILAASGLVAVAFDHRYPSLAGAGTAVADIEAAIGYVRAHAAELGADPERLALWAFSGAGVLMAPFLEERPSYFRCLVAFYPLLDLSAFAAFGFDGVPAGDPGAWSPVRALDGDRGLPPLFIARAGKDHPEVNRSLDAFVGAALERGAVLDLLNHPTGIHGFDVLDAGARSQEIVRRAVAFVRHHLGEPEPR